jgi:hypothetical protein
MDKMPLKVREKALELQRKYPDQFIMREVTPQNQARVMEEMRELLRGQGLTAWRGLEMKLERSLDRARDDLAQHLELMSGRVREWGWNDGRQRWTRELSPEQLREYQALDAKARSLWVVEQDHGLELFEVREQIPEIEWELAQVRSERARRENELDRAVEREQQQAIEKYVYAREWGLGGPQFGCANRIWIGSSWPGRHWCSIRCRGRWCGISWSVPPMNTPRICRL